MNITLNQVVPFPLDGIYDPDSQIWGQKLTFDTSKRYKVSAPSGKGKSTLIHSIFGLRKDYTGSVSIDGNIVHELPHPKIAEIRRGKLSVIFQDLRLFLDLTARENLEVKQVLYDNRSPVIDIQEMTDKLGVTRLMEKPAKFLSYGERQRFAIIRALSQPFEWLMMDEPFSHLDEGNIEIACTLIEEVCKRNNAGFVIVSLGYDYRFTYDETVRL